MIGYGAVVAALLVTMVAVVLFFLASSRKQAGKPKLSSRARSLYIFSTLLIGVAAFCLMYILLSSRFEYAYVVSYSSRDLPLAYKVSAFWAGQEGSLMLWLVFHAAFGLVLLRKQDTALPVMAVYSLVQAAFLGLLLIKSPFMLLSEQPIDGVGLNFLLRDPWMVIHPPILFMGYAALAVPFSYGMGAMLKERHQEWLDAASVWTLLVLSSLGAGMFIGGFWAYKVLGWGGYWAWDPVENSSLVPWIAAVAVVHLLFMAKVRAGAIKYAYTGIIASFVLMLYGTFLTRSGILSDFSTHSFADEGLGGFLGMLVIITAYAACVAYILKRPGMPSGELYPGLSSKEFVLFLTALVLALFGMLVFAGTSIPLVTTALGSPKSVSSAFYNQAALPLTAAIGALLTTGPLVTGKNGWSYVGSRQIGWLGLFLAGGLMLAGWLNLYQPLCMATLCLALTAVAANGYAAFTRQMSGSAACSHIGAAILMIGIIASSTTSQSATVSLVQGQSQKVFDYQISYSGIELGQSEKALYKIFHVGPNKVTALTKLDKQGVPSAREPAIYRSMLSDIYITPSITEKADTGQEVILVKGQPLSQNGITMNFIKLTLKGMDGISEPRVQAVIEVTVDGQTQRVQPELVSENGKFIGTIVTAFERYQLQITGFRPGGNQLTVEFRDTNIIDSAVQLEAEISTKPLINLVWLGALLIITGTGWSGIKKLISINNSKIGNLIDKSSVDL